MALLRRPVHEAAAADPRRTAVGLDLDRATVDVQPGVLVDLVLAHLLPAGRLMAITRAAPSSECSTTGLLGSTVIDVRSQMSMPPTVSQAVKRRRARLVERPVEKPKAR